MLLFWHASGGQTHVKSIIFRCPGLAKTLLGSWESDGKQAPLLAPSEHSSCSHFTAIGVHWGLLSLGAAWWCSSLCHFVSQRGKSQQRGAGGDNLSCLWCPSPTGQHLHLGRVRAFKLLAGLYLSCWLDSSCWRKPGRRGGFSCPSISQEAASH